MSDRSRTLSVLFANIAFALGVIFWSGFSYSDLKDNTVEIEENRAEIKLIKDAVAESLRIHNEDILYIRINMITKSDLKDVINLINSRNE